MTYLPKFINNQQAIRSVNYACNFLWIGSHPIPLQGICNLYFVAKSYTGTQGQFIPTLCLDTEAILHLEESVVLIEIIRLENCPNNYKHIQIAASKLINCKFLVKIDLYLDKDIVYIPLIIIESIYDIIKLKLRNFVYSEEICNFDANNVPPEYFHEDTMFNYLITEVIDYLYDRKLYVQVSDLIRLFILSVHPGCYLDITDIKITRLPLNSDFAFKFLTHKKENYLIVSLSAHIMLNILCSMYVSIRHNKNNFDLPCIDLSYTMNTDLAVNNAISNIFNKSSEECIFEGINFDENNYPQIKLYLYYHQYAQEFFVDFIAGFQAWIAIVSIIQNFTILRYGVDEDALAIPCEVFPNLGGQNLTMHFSYRDPLKNFKERLLFLGSKININNRDDDLLLIKEIDDIAKKYSVIDKHKIIILAMISDYWRQEENTETSVHNIKPKTHTKLFEKFSSKKNQNFNDSEDSIQQLINKAKYKEQELYNVTKLPKAVTRL